MYKSEVSFKSHLKDHNRQHQCQLCGHNFSRNFFLKEHLKFHKDKFAFRCEKCQKNLSSSSILRTHMRTHDKNRIKEHKCKFCEYSTDQKAHLTIHLQIHDINREKPFKCNQCDYKTDQKEHLKSHLLIHNPNRVKFPCLYFNYEGTTRSSLNYHLKHQHNPKRVKHLKCPHCSYKTDCKSYFKVHEKRHQRN
ncbi:hypothetical protein PVAND_017359 [Polypedilum vanderplanki]|uniref:C2H2-type domain-containing protein n=1 Tax=Polypedilum vanderplanki TaxID=319348 RepID=A0A9J6BIG2_POLVA|nr:hypothetical protein PVAND_017359 [Polypedilum vanderplanki]